MRGFDGWKALATLVAGFSWTVALASAQPAQVPAQFVQVPAPPAEMSAESTFAEGAPKVVRTATSNVLPAPARDLKEALPSPSELRIRLLYSGREFSTFQQSSTGATGRGETRILKRSFDPQIEDRWLAFDKVQHVTFSFLWTLGTQYIVVNKGRISEHHALPVSISSSALVGVSKEYYDLKIGPTNYFSLKDLAADAFGILLATGVVLL